MMRFQAARALDANSPEGNHRTQIGIASRDGCSALAFHGVSMGFVLLGCTAGHDVVRDVLTEDASSPGVAADSGSPDGAQDPEFDAGQVRLGEGAEACSADDSLSLAMIPEFLTVFQRANSSCQPLGSGVLFQNTGSAPLRIDGVQASAAEFSLVGGSFPADLEPGAFLPLRVHYRGVQNGAVEARLTLASAQGCRDFRFQGLRTAESLITRTDEALDFGSVAAGAFSDSRRLSVRTEIATGSTVTFHAFGVDPPDLFEIVAATSPETEVTACDTRDVDVRFHAPSRTGTFEGALLWIVTTSTAAGDAEGTMLVPLYAVVTGGPG